MPDDLPEDPSGWQIPLVAGEWWPVRKSDEATLDPQPTKPEAVAAIATFEG